LNLDSVLLHLGIIRVLAADTFCGFSHDLPAELAIVAQRRCCFRSLYYMLF